MVPPGGIASDLLTLMTSIALKLRAISALQNTTACHDVRAWGMQDHALSLRIGWHPRVTPAEACWLCAARRCCRSGRAHLRLRPWLDHAPLRGRA